MANPDKIPIERLDATPEVLLGFCEIGKTLPYQLESYQFPSKMGGKPAWLELRNLPTPEELQCPLCKDPMIFLLQIYAPTDKSEDPHNFHRTIFVFVCTKEQCCTPNSSANFKAFRSNLPRYNEYYSSEPSYGKRKLEFSVDKWTKLCNLCGCMSTKHCAKCKVVEYCSREHQIMDWREGHREKCCKPVDPLVKTEIEHHSRALFMECEIEIDTEDFPTEPESTEEDELEKFRQLQEQGNAGVLDNVPVGELEAHALVDPDEVFTRFKERVALDNDQVVRYQRGGLPLWIASKPLPDVIPICEICGAARQFEFQIMPQMLALSKEMSTLDWGVVAIYTCSMSCNVKEGYKEEYVFKQDIV